MERTLDHREAESFYDRLGAAQDSQSFYEDRALDELVAHADLATAEVVLELGCGTGRLGARLLEASPRLHYTGIDVSGTMVGLSAARLARFGPRARVVKTDGSPKLDFADGSFDRMFSAYVFDLLSEADITRLLDESYRVLRESGLLCTVGLTPGERGPSRLVTAVWTRVERLSPRLVGGCRPVRLASFLDRSRFHVVHHRIVTAWGVPSEVLIANKARGA